ncbi:hypothetical protein GCM10010124_04590 [Pilimelia terevasa]|uniref:Uncharacterized protein n=1 Tax=Pilimelia terevasa TaxID=53372 RepID=A0A8J3FG07_9ACTN|nr:hypothetical protein [Pilimelia terevasa]GGK15043.1 hypothetical protein GCM10010124_04590 [Pilimelia terevasa]
MTPDLAVAAGVDFLRRAAVAGRWSAFHLYPGVSDEWVTAYVAALLAEAEVPGTGGLVAAATAGLRGRQRRDGRFGFNARAIGDADSTLWVLRLAAATGEFPGDRPAAVAAVGAHVRRDGVATYAADEPIRTIIEAGPERSMKGWCGAHPCVTAVAAGLADTAAAAGAALRAQQRRDGSWPAYWWTAPEYTAAHAAEALGDDTAARAGEWAAGRLAGGAAAGADGGPFASALALRAMVAGGAPAAAVDSAVGRLCRQIRLDGAWAASAQLRVPDPDDPDPDTPGLTRWVPGGRKEGAVVRDRTGVFTTATVVAALVRAGAR